VSPRLKLATKFVGVIERAVVNEGNFTRAIDVGVRILIGLSSVGGPTGVCDADVMTLEAMERSLTSSRPSAFSPTEAYFVTVSPSEGTPDMVAIPALSYPRFFKIVRPSKRKSLASPDPPTTPAIPQQSALLVSFATIAEAPAAAAAAARSARELEPFSVF